MRLAPWSFLFLLAACKGGGSNPAACKRDADELQAFLRSVNSGSQPINVPLDAKLVVRSDLPALTARSTAPSVYVAAGRIEVDGTVVPDPAALREHLLEWRNRAEDKAKPDDPEPVHWFVEFDPAVPWSQVVAIVEAANNAGLHAPAFVFAVADTTKPPPRTPVDDELDQLDKVLPADRATGLAKILEKEIAGCTALQRVFSSVGRDESVEKSTYVINGFGPALVECQCHANLLNLRSAMFRVIHNANAPHVLAFDPEAEPTELAMPATMPWSEASAQLKPDLKAATFVVKAP